MKNNFFTKTAITALAATCIVSSACSKKQEVVKRTHFLLNTQCTIQVYGERDEAVKAIELAFSRVEEIEKKFNFRNEGSPIYKFNNNGAPITDAEIIKVVEKALKVSEQSEGAFDITVGPLLKAWGFYNTNKSTRRMPDEKTLAGAMKNVGYKKLQIINGALTKTVKDVRIDLGGIAAGYAAGETARILKSSGIESALIDMGGEIYALGLIYDKPWKVAIQDPRSREGILGTISMNDMSVSSSGDYESYFKKGSKIFHHILDPRTGMPSEGLISATVFAKDPVTADAWSTAILVLGEKRWMKTVERVEGIEALVVNTQEKIFYSKGLTGSVSLDHEPLHTRKSDQKKIYRNQ